MLIALLVLFICCPVFAQTHCVNDTIFREIQFPLTESDTETLFLYFNDEWIPGARVDMIDTDSIVSMTIKKDRHNNSAIFLTVSPETLSQLKAKAKAKESEVWAHHDPVCEFPGGNGKLKEWLNANIRVPKDYKGSERVIVSFFVQPDGTITDPRILRPSKNEAANTEALRLVNALPKFRVKYFTPEKSPLGMALPIIFREPGAIIIRGTGDSSDGQLTQIL